MEYTTCTKCMMRFPHKKAHAKARRFRCPVPGCGRMFWEGLKDHPMWCATVYVEPPLTLEEYRREEEPVETRAFVPMGRKGTGAQLS